MNKRLKEKDEEAANELKKKQEELRNLLQKKEREYEVHFHVLLFCFFWIPWEDPRCVQSRRNMVNFSNVFVQYLDFDDTSYQWYFIEK